MAHWAVEVQVLSSAWRKRTRPVGPRFRRGAPQVVLPPMREACAAAVDAALGAGASYADARAILRRSQSVGTRNGRVITLTDAETEGIGVRVLVGGSWGFACDRRLSTRSARERRRYAPAPSPPRPAATAARGLAPLEARSGTFRPPVEIDPFAVPLGRQGRALPARRGGDAQARGQGRPGVGPGAAGAEALPLLRRGRDRAGAGRVRRGHRRDRRRRRRGRPAAQLSERPRRLERPGRVGVRRGARSRTRGAAGRRAGGRSCSARTSARRA